LIVFDVEVDADARLSLTLIENLLKADATCGVHPHGNLRHILENRWILSHKLEFVSFYAVQSFLAVVGDVPFVG
jgi:hypothetical protein